MMFYFFKSSFFYTFFKVFIFRYFLIIDVYLGFYCFFFLLIGCLLFLLFIIFKNLLKNFGILFCFFFLIVRILKFFFFKFLLNIFILFILFFYRIRFFFFFGASYTDPLNKIMFDNLFNLKGEFLMQFYNFTHRYIFENFINVPISVFSFDSFFDSTKFFYYLKIYHRMYMNLVVIQNKVRTFYFFRRGQNFNKKFKYSKYSYQKHNVLFSDLLFFLKKNTLFIFNFVSSDFFLFLRAANVALSTNFKLSFLKLVLLKYLTFLKSCFLFILVDFERDMFLNYIGVTLHKLAKSNYYKQQDWKNLQNNYQLFLTHSAVFSGDVQTDRKILLNSLKSYLIIYLNFLFFFFITFFILVSRFFVFFVFTCLDIFFSFNIIYDIFDFIKQFYISFIRIYFFSNFVFSLLLFLSFSFFKFRLFYLIFIFYVKQWFFFCFNFLFLVLIIIRLQLVILYLPFSKLPFSGALLKLHFSRNLASVLYSNIQNCKHFSGKIFAEFFFSRFIISGFGDYFLSKKNEGFIENQIFSYNDQEQKYFANQKDSFPLDFFFFNLKFLLIHSAFYNHKTNSWFSFLIFFKNRLLGFLLYSINRRTNNFNFFDISTVNFYTMLWKLYFTLFIFDFFIESIFFFFYSLFSILFRIFKIFYFFFKRVIYFCFFFFCSLVIIFKSLLFFFIDFFILGCIFLFYFFWLWGLFILFFLIGAVILFCFINFIFLKFVFLIFLGIFLSCIILIVKMPCVFNLCNSLTFLNIFSRIFFSVNLYFFYFYYNLLKFFVKRNLGFFQILSIFFSIRNDLKKYEIMHMKNSSIFFNTFNVDFILYDFLFNYKNKNSLNFTKSFSFNKLFGKSFLFEKMSSYEGNLNKFKNINVDKYRYIKINSDVFSEFEYHKYLRTRSSRSVETFRFRKFLNPVDFHSIKTLDHLADFDSNTFSAFINFDSLQNFYNDDFFFFKNLVFFRNVFARKNLSFFHNDLDKLSAFRLKYNKISPIFKYFFLKRERLKYALTSYNFGNINSFSFITISNWILNYRILRAIINIFDRQKSIFFNKNFFFKFSILKLVFMLDKYVFICNHLFVIFFLFFAIFYFLEFSFYLWLVFFYFYIQFFGLKKINFFTKFLHERPLFLNITTFLGFLFNSVTVPFFSKKIMHLFFFDYFFCLVFSSRFRILSNLLIFNVCFFLCSYFNISFYCFFNESSLLFLDDFICFNFFVLDLKTHNIVCYFLVPLNYLTLFIFFIGFRLFLFLFYFFSYFFLRIVTGCSFFSSNLDSYFFFVFNFLLHMFKHFFFSKISVSVFFLIKELDLVIHILKLTNNHIKEKFIKKSN